MKTQTKLLITGNVALLFLLIWLLIRGNYHQTFYNMFKTGNGDQKITYWFNREELFEKLPKDSTAIIFLGTSLTQNFELAELFRRADVLNRGIMGDITAGVLQRLQPVINSRPRKIFIEVGINDLFSKTEEDSLLKNYRHIVERLHTGSPRTEIYIQSILPVLNSSSMLTQYEPARLNEHVISVNQKLKEYALRNNLHYVDLYSKFSANNELNPAYTFDGVHLNGDGYLLWTKIVTPYLED